MARKKSFFMLLAGCFLTKTCFLLMDKGIGAVKNEIDFVQLSQGVKTLCSEAVIWLLRMA